MKHIVNLLRRLRAWINFQLSLGGTFFVDQLSDEELALFHDPERP